MRFSRRFLILFFIPLLTITSALAQTSKSTDYQDVKLILDTDIQRKSTVKNDSTDIKRGNLLLNKSISRRSLAYSDSALSAFLEEFDYLYNKGIHYFDESNFDSALVYLKRAQDKIFYLDPSLKTHYKSIDISKPLEEYLMYREDGKLFFKFIESKSYENIINRFGKRPLSNEAKRLKNKYEPTSSDLRYGIKKMQQSWFDSEQVSEQILEGFFQYFPSTKFLEIWDNQFPILFMIGNTQEEKGQYEEAIQTYYLTIELMSSVLLGQVDNLRELNRLWDISSVVGVNKKLVKSVFNLVASRVYQGSSLITNCFFRIETIAFSDTVNPELKMKAKKTITNLGFLEAKKLFSPSGVLIETIEKYPSQKKDIINLKKEYLASLKGLKSRYRFPNPTIAMDGGKVYTKKEYDIARNAGIKKDAALLFFFGKSEKNVCINIDSYKYVGVLNKKSFVYSYVSPGIHTIQVLQIKGYRQMAATNNTSKLNFEAGKIYHIEVDKKKPVSILSSDEGLNFVNRKKMSNWFMKPDEFFIQLSQ